MKEMQTTLTIRPKKTLSLKDITELWSYRELLYFFTWRDFKVRYKQTFIGVVWALFQPIMSMVVFSLFFGKLANVPSDGVPYPIFVYIGLLFWQFFSDALSDTSNSLINNQSIVTKVYFPRLILPVSTVATKLVDFGIAAIVFIGLMFYYQFIPSLEGLLLLPLLLIVTFMAALGGGLFLASINVRYRDVRYILPYFIQLFMFITPVIYSSSIAGKYSWVLALNPMSGVIQTARAAFLHTAPINWLLVSISLVASVLILIVGTITFKKTERFFADII
jgi:lipopolysaccharide transport system permease protein